MILKDILELIQAKPFYVSDESVLEHDFTSAFASDLMSDALALVDGDTSSTMLITGLANAQALRTAEMLDIHTILYVRGKIPQSDCEQLAKENGFNLFISQDSMYETCGRLYKAGLGPNMKV